MTTAIQKKRLQRRFELWDTNHDGTIWRSDYQAEANRTVRAFGESMSSPIAQRVVAAYLGIWDYLAPRAGIAGNGSMNIGQFTSVIQQELQTPGDSGLGKVLRSTTNAIVALIDSDGDHRVNRAEFAKWGESVGLSEKDIEMTFERIDKNGDGLLDVDELADAVRDYHLGNSDVSVLDH